MLKAIGFTLAAAATLAGATAAQADDLITWRDHAAPFSFRFGNHIDTHQQTRLARDGSLMGFFYVSHTGVVTKDGYKVATHVDCNARPDCVVGWLLAGVPAKATFLFHPMHDHPIFHVPRAQIPQPGSYSHFHWLGEAMPQPGLPVDGYMLRLVATSRFCFIHHGAGGATPALDCVDNGGVKVDLGVDIATHLNILPALPTM
jgi:hypothetical protein